MFILEAITPKNSQLNGTKLPINAEKEGKYWPVVAYCKLYEQFVIIYLFFFIKPVALRQEMVIGILALLQYFIMVAVV